MKLLLVEDESDLRRMLATFLGEEGFEVAQAENGEEALGKIGNPDQYDVIVSDIRMPKMDGLELLKEIRSAKNQVPFIVMTGYSPYTEAEVLGNGANGFIQKPFETDELITIIKNLKSSDQSE